MDIKNIQSGSAGAAEPSRRARGVDQNKPAAQASEGSSDLVALSGQAQALQQSRKAALSVPEVRTDRVQEIRSKIADGGLRIDPARIAKALLDQNILG